MRILIYGGYILSLSDAREWAIRHCDGIKIDDSEPRTITGRIKEYYRLNNMKAAFACSLQETEEDGSVCFFAVDSKRSIQTIPEACEDLEETERSKAIKDLIFNMEGDERIKEKARYASIPDPSHLVRPFGQAWRTRKIDPSEI